MKKTNKWMLAVVIILVLLFGVGQFFAFLKPTTSTILPSTTSTPAAQTLATPPTEIIAYIPSPTPSTPVQQGSCWTNSIAAPYRADAWRCTVGNAISDPCFQIATSTTLLCGVNPADTNSTSSFVLKLTKPLPKAESLPGTPPSNWAWLLQLQDGTLCSPFTGTRPFTADDQSANYACAPGANGVERDIFGDLNTSSSIWLADIGTLSMTTSTLPIMATSQEVTVAKVWQ